MDGITCTSAGFHHIGVTVTNTQTLSEIKEILIRIRDVDKAIVANPMEIGNLIVRHQLQRQLTQLESTLGFTPSFDL